MNPLEIIVACDPDFGIGKGGAIPWRIPEDLRNFRKLTTEGSSGRMNALIMGRKTWESLPVKPLPGRHNIVVSSSLEDERAFVVPSWASAVDKAQELNAGRVFAIGGHMIYKAALEDSRTKILHFTQVLDRYECDVFFPIDPDLTGDFERRKGGELLGGHALYFRLERP